MSGIFRSGGVSQPSLVSTKDLDLINVYSFFRFPTIQVFFGTVTVPASPYDQNLYTVPSGYSLLISAIHHRRVTGTGNCRFKNNIGGLGTLYHFWWLDQPLKDITGPIIVLEEGDILVHEGTAQNDVFNIAIFGRLVPSSYGFKHIIHIARTIPATPFKSTEYTVPAGKTVQLTYASHTRTSGTGSMILYLDPQGSGDTVFWISESSTNNIISSLFSGNYPLMAQTLVDGDTIDSVGTAQNDVMNIYVCGRVIP